MHQLCVVLNTALSAQNALLEIGAERVELCIGFRKRRAVRRVQGERGALQCAAGVGQGNEGGVGRERLSG